MKITDLRTHVVKVPLESPIRTAIHDIESVGCVCLELVADDELCGQSYVFSINALRIGVFEQMIKGLTHHVLGQDPHFVTAIWESIWQEINPSGHKGITISALSAIDVACWDLVGKSASLPLHKMFGANKRKVKTYASGGLWLSQSIDELERQSEQFLQQGFTSLKIRVGKDNISEDIERVRAVRNVVGDDVEILTDANQALSVKQAIRLAEKLAKLDVHWLEEPVPAYDLKGHAQVRQKIQIDLASGETEYTRFGMQSMLEQNACDILMPDLQRIGGYTEMRRSAALASANNIPISTHIFTEHSLCIGASAENCISVEHMPWFAPLFKESIIIKDGYIEVPERSGTGFSFDEDALKEYFYSIQ